MHHNIIIKTIQKNKSLENTKFHDGGIDITYSMNCTHRLDLISNTRKENKNINFILDTCLQSVVTIKFKFHSSDRIYKAIY